MLKLTYAFLTLFIVGLRAFAITGISAGVNTATGERPFRQEINAFAGSGAAWDLFILSLRQLQHTNQNDSLSYFQISGKPTRGCVQLNIILTLHLPPQAFMGTHKFRGMALMGRRAGLGIVCTLLCPFLPGIDHTWHSMR